MDPHALARAEELSLQINLLHVSYLQADESPEKLEQRTKLESYIRKYLCLIAHGRKFVFPETAEILRRSVESKSNFSAYRASSAWNAIARYAANLVAQPWRKEFRVIKTFSGFYIHDIEENLVFAERLLDCMGYKRVDHSSLVLEQPLDLDAVINVSRDAIVAFVECQIMKEIWEGVYSQFECSWLEILNFRESHVCSPESAIKSLSYHYHQNCYHQQQIIAASVSHDPYMTTSRYHHHSPQTSCLYGQTASPQMNLPYYGYSPYASCVAPPQPRYACVMNPQQMISYTMPHGGYHHPAAKSPVQSMPSNGYYPQPLQPLAHSSGLNGYSMPQAAAVPLPQNFNCIVPTGQLIELESSSTGAPASRPLRSSLPSVEDIRSPGAGSSERRTTSGGAMPTRESAASIRSDMKSMRPTTLEDLKPKRNGLHSNHLEDTLSHLERSAGGKQPQRSTSKKTGMPAAPMQDGTGTWESWDYVYRNLESQGYSKDVGERGDILHSSTFPRRGSEGSAGSSPLVNSTIIRNSRNVRDTEIAAGQLTDAVQSIQLTCDESLRGRGLDTVDARTIKNAMKDKAGPKCSYTGNKPLQRDHQREVEISSQMTRNVQEHTEKDLRDFWECSFCTYHNEIGKVVCEMCGKSRAPGSEEKPLVSGGRECPKCTLVNARGVVACEACNESLKNSPTYI